MNPTQHPTNNCVFGPPRGHNQDEMAIEPLHVTVERADMEAGVPHSLPSFWEPTPEEIAMLEVGGKVRLRIYGAMHPPVWLEVVPG